MKHYKCIYLFYIAKIIVVGHILTENISSEMFQPIIHPTSITHVCNSGGSEAHLKGRIGKFLNNGIEEIKVSPNNEIHKNPNS